MRKRFAAFLSLIVLLGSVLTPLAEAGLWADRRSALAGHRPPAPAFAPIAALPAAGPVPGETAAGRLARAFSVRHGTLQRPIVPSRRGPAVLILQDVHLNLEAQRNLAELLSAYAADGVDAVGIEAAFDRLDVSALRAWPDAGLTRAVAADFLRANLISGPSFAAVTAERPFGLFAGIDDAGLYRANVAAYRTARAARPAVEAQLAAERRALEAERDASMSEPVRAFVARRSAQAAGRLALSAHLEFLAAHAPAAGAARDFLAAFRAEAGLDFSAAERERRAALAAVAARASADEMTRLAGFALGARLGRASPGDLRREMEALMVRAGVPLDRFPNLAAYHRYSRAAEAISYDALMKDLERMEAAFLRSHATPAERRLAGRLHRLDLADRLVRFELTPREWDLLAAAPESPLPGLDAFASFYREADARSDAMAKKILDAAAATGRGEDFAGVAVVGGFHAPRLERALRRAGVAVGVASPRLVTARGGTDYLTAFERDQTPLDRLFRGEKLFLAPQSAVLGGRHAGNAAVSDLFSAVQWIEHNRGAAAPLPRGAAWRKAGDGFAFEAGGTTIRGRYRPNGRAGVRLHDTEVTRTRSLRARAAGVIAFLGASGPVAAWAGANFSTSGAPASWLVETLASLGPWAAGVFGLFMLAPSAIQAFGPDRPEEPENDLRRALGFPYNFPRMASGDGADEIDAYYAHLQGLSQRYRETLLRDTDDDAEEAPAFNEGTGDYDAGLDRLTGFLVSTPRYLQKVIRLDMKGNRERIAAAWRRATGKKRYMGAKAFSDAVASLSGKSPAQMAAFLDEHPEFLVPVFLRADESFSISTNVIRVGADVQAEIESFRREIVPTVRAAAAWARRQWTEIPTRKAEERKALQRRILVWLRLRATDANATVKKEDVDGFLKAHKTDLRDLDLPAEIENAPGVTDQDRIAALFAALVHTQGPSDHVIQAILAYAYEDTPVRAAIDDEENSDRVVSAVDQIVNDRFRNHLARETGIAERALAARVGETLARYRRESARLGRAIGASVSEDETALIVFDPMGFEAGYRGHIGEDCTKCVSDNAFAALHPANHYYRPRGIDGYVGFTEAQAIGKPGLKFIALDTIQSPDSKIPSRAIPAIIDEIAAWGRERGYAGVTLPIDLGPSFNHEQVRQAVEALPGFLHGPLVALEAVHPDLTELLHETEAVNVSESLSNQLFVVVTPFPGKAAEPLNDIADAVNLDYYLASLGISTYEIDASYEFLKKISEQWTSVFKLPNLAPVERRVREAIVADIGESASRLSGEVAFARLVTRYRLLLARYIANERSQGRLEDEIAKDMFADIDHLLGDLNDTGDPTLDIGGFMKSPRDLPSLVRYLALGKVEGLHPGIVDAVTRATLAPFQSRGPLINQLEDAAPEGLAFTYEGMLHRLIRRFRRDVLKNSGRAADQDASAAWAALARKLGMADPERMAARWLSWPLETVLVLGGMAAFVAGGLPWMAAVWFLASIPALHVARVVREDGRYVSRSIFRNADGSRAPPLEIVARFAGHYVRFAAYFAPAVALLFSSATFTDPALIAAALWALGAHATWNNRDLFQNKTEEERIARELLSIAKSPDRSAAMAAAVARHGRLEPVFARPGDAPADWTKVKEALKEELTVQARGLRPDDIEGRLRLADLYSVLDLVLSPQERRRFAGDIEETLALDGNDVISAYVDSAERAAALINRVEAEAERRGRAGTPRYVFGTRTAAAPALRALAAQASLAGRVQIVEDAGRIDALLDAALTRPGETPQIRFFVLEGVGLPDGFFDLDQHTWARLKRDYGLLVLFLTTAFAAVELETSHLPDWQAMRRAMIQA